MSHGRKEISYRELHAIYDDFLDEIYKKIELLGCTYAPSHVLRRVDPVAYRCGFNDWFDSQSDLYEELSDGTYVLRGDDTDDEEGS
jgi:hypothetical protein